MSSRLPGAPPRSWRRSGRSPTVLGRLSMLAWTLSCWPIFRNWRLSIVPWPKSETISSSLPCSLSLQSIVRSGILSFLVFLVTFRLTAALLFIFLNLFFLGNLCKKVNDLGQNVTFWLDARIPEDNGPPRWLGAAGEEVMYLPGNFTRRPSDSTTQCLAADQDGGWLDMRCTNSIPSVVEHARRQFVLCFVHPSSYSFPFVQKVHDACFARTLRLLQMPGRICFLQGRRGARTCLCSCWIQAVLH